METKKNIKKSKKKKAFRDEIKFYVAEKSRQQTVTNLLKSK